MSLIEAGIYDSILFIVSLFIAFIFIFKKTNASLRWFLIMYVLLTYSSYNIMIKPIHDYNIVIPRTAFFHLKIISILSVADIFMIITFTIFSLLYLMKNKIIFYKNILLNIIYIGMIRDLVLLLIGTIGFFIYMLNTSSDYYSIADQFRNARGLIYISVFLFFTYSILNNQKLSFMKIFYIFIFLDLINLGSGFIATLLYKDYVWQRYFLNVVILDQDDTGITMFYATIFFTSIIIGKKMKLPFFYNIVIFMSTVLMVLTFSKGFFVYLFLLYIFSLVIIAQNKKNFIPKLFSLLLVIGLLFPAISYFSKSSAINTRLAQINDYFTYINHIDSQISLLAGIGYGGFYKESDPSLYDSGSMKKIDIKNHTGLRTSIQTPLVCIIKDSGMLGFFIFLIVGFFLLFKFLKTIKLGVFEIATSFYLMFYIFFQNILLFPEPSKILVLFKIVILYVLYKRDKGVRYVNN